MLTRRIVDRATIKDKAGMVELEIGILKELNHPNIVSFLDTFESKHKYVHLLCVQQVELIERYYISLELAWGGPLNDWIGVPFVNCDMMKEGGVIHCVKYVPLHMMY